MNQMPKKSNLNNLIQFLGLGVLLIVFPLGSWYYLSEGFQYQKDAYAELKDYGAVPSFSLIGQNEKPFTLKEIENKIAVVGFFSRSGKTTPQLMEQLSELHQQFKDRKDILFLMYHLTPGTSDIMTLKDMAAKTNVEDWDQCMFLTGDENSIRSHFKSTYKIPLFKEGRAEDGNLKFKPIKENTSEFPYFVLVDANGKIRNYYDINNKEDIQRLVEHLAILMPRENKKDKI